ncbi:MAG: hypothetical protein CMN76_01590 [Spirochaetaceae bacterium]|nr:hypothetical protein [Spirochaetaceae bacterium]
MKTSKRNKPQLSILAPLELPSGQLASLYKRIKRRKSRLLVLAALPDPQNLPHYLSGLKERTQQSGAALRILWNKDIGASSAGLVKAIQESPEYAQAKEIILIAPESWQRTDIQSIVEGLRMGRPEGPDSFKPSRFSIRLKLLLITGSIVSLALAAMIGMASYLFRVHSETLIQGYNLSLARLVSESLEKDILDIQYRSRSLLDRLKSESPTLSLEEPWPKPEPTEESADTGEEQAQKDRSSTPASKEPEKQTLEPKPATEKESATEAKEPESVADAEQQKPATDAKEQRPAQDKGESETESTKDPRPGHGGYVSARRFFEENDRYLYLSVVKYNQDSISLTEEFFNGPFLKEYELDAKRFREYLKQWPPQALQEGPLEFRRFQMEDVPLLGLSFSGDDGRIILYLAADDFFQSFRKARQAGLFEIHLISGDGTILISSETEGVTPLEKHTIIEEILESPVDNGSRKYVNGEKEYLASFQTLEQGLTVLSHAEADKVFEAVARIERQNLYLMGAVLAAAFLLVFLFARTLSVPIIRLVQATGAVRKGEYDVKIHPTTRDEIGQLTYSFLQMTRGLQEREHIKEAFGKFVNPGIAEKALRGEIKLGGERRWGTVFFSDLRDFTELSEKNQPEEVVDFLNRYFTAMVDCIQATGGMVDKFIGDAIMAHWGTLVPSETDTADAVRAALMMRKSLIELNQAFAREGAPPLRSGCGINTGPVIAGQIGSEKRLEYTVIGDTVNLASRIEYLNKLFGTDILISSYSMERIQGQFEAVEMPPLRIKGKRQPEVVYAILGSMDDPERPRSLEELRNLVGIEFDKTRAAEELKRSSDQMVSGESREKK